MRAIEVMSALAQPTRLEVFSILASRTPEGLSAGSIAGLTNTPANTLSAHLAILSRAGLVTSARHGRSIVYKASEATMQELILFLLTECCEGHPEQCRDQAERLQADTSSAPHEPDS